MNHQRKKASMIRAFVAPAVIAATLAILPASGTAREHITPTTPAARQLVHPDHVHLAGGETRKQAGPIIHVAEELYTFWNTGNAKYLDRADVPNFHDNTPPAGRKQGRIGILDASRTFRAAVPDLRCRLVNLYITGSTFTAQQIYSGHFTGTLDGHHGHGQVIRFNAIDIQHVGAGGRITEDWHIEDNLTFLEQAGVVTAP